MRREPVRGSLLLLSFDTMAHSHSHDSSSNLKVAFFLNLAFTIIEIIGGLWTNSIAILSDAIHDFGDTASLGLAWYFDRLSKRESNEERTYGYRRYRLLGGLITGVVLSLGLGFVLWQAIARLANPEAVNAPGMMGLAVIGILFNGAAVLRVKSGTSLTERVVSWHLIEDALGWVAVLIGAGIMSIWDLPIVDPLLSIGISLFILWNVVRNLKEVGKVFLQIAPDSFHSSKFKEEIGRLPKVISSHHTHAWSLDGESHVLTTHVVMEAGTSREEILRVKGEIRGLLDQDAFENLTIDIELEGEECSADPRRSLEAE